jgi:hypothetical protein
MRVVDVLTMAGFHRTLLLFSLIALQLGFTVHGQKESSPKSSPPKVPGPKSSPPKVPGPKLAGPELPAPKLPGLTSQSPKSPDLTGLGLTHPVVANSPETDDFYKPSAGFEKAALGTILKYRPVPNPLKIEKSLGPLKLASAWQILYRTQNSRDQPEAAVLTLLVPYNAKKGNLFSLSYFDVCFPATMLETLAKLHPRMRLIIGEWNYYLLISYSASVLTISRCDPSFALQSIDPSDNLFIHFQTMIAVGALSQGWYVSIADDGGTQAAQRKYLLY